MSSGVQGSRGARTSLVERIIDRFDSNETKQACRIAGMPEVDIAVCKEHYYVMKAYLYQNMGKQNVRDAVLAVVRNALTLEPTKYEKGDEVLIYSGMYHGVRAVVLRQSKTTSGLTARLAHVGTEVNVMPYEVRRVS